MSEPPVSLCSTQRTFYHVEKQATLERECPCGHSTMWTITYHDGKEDIEIGTSWQGPEGKEHAEDICDLMNMAFDAGKESAERAETEARKERLAERWS